MKKKVKSGSKQAAVISKDDRNGLKDGVRHTIWGIAFLAFCIFFLLSSRGLAGFIGNKTYEVSHYLLGAGFYLIPTISLLVAVSFFKSHQPRLALVRAIGSLFFVLSGLGIIERGFGDETSHPGGIIGFGIASASDRLFGTASWAIFVAVFLISLVLIFETVFSFEKILAWWRSRKEIVEDDAEAALDDLDEEIEEMVENEPEPLQIQKPQESAASKVRGMFGLGKDTREEFVPFVRADQSPYTPPPLDLLGRDSGKPGAGDIKANSNIIKRTLSNFGIEVEMDEISIGPSITRYALKPAEGVKLSRIVALQNDLALSLAAHPLRVEAPIPGKSLVGIEVPNSVKTTVRLGSLLADANFAKSDKPLLVAMGKDITGAVTFTDVAKSPHLLIAGTTGSGKSVAIHSLIISLLYRNGPSNLRFLMIDPKRVELTLYNNTPHLLTPVITNPKKAILALKWAAKEMDRRYDILEAEAARDIKSYHENVYNPALDKYNKSVKDGTADNASLPEAMPYIVIVIDELADIMSSYPRELESAIVRVAQMSRAVGIHLILSTQRPSTEVITGLIKANIPSRVALQVPSQIDSRTIIDMPGAEKLLGAGDMLYLSGETSKPVRLQSAFVSEAEVKKVVSFISGHNESPAETPALEIAEAGGSVSDNGVSGGFDDEASEDDDELFEQAREIVQKIGRASSSLLQRKLKVGYARAARLLDMLEERGVVGAGSGAKPREVFGATPSATDEYGEEFSAQGGPASGWEKTEENL